MRPGHEDAVQKESLKIIRKDGALVVVLSQMFRRPRARGAPLAPPPGGFLFGRRLA